MVGVRFWVEIRLWAVFDLIRFWVLIMFDWIGFWLGVVLGGCGGGAVVIVG